MFKIVTKAYRKPGLSDEEFYTHWRDRHGPLAARLVPGLRKYTQNHVVRTPGTESDVDGFTELWFDDREAYERYLAWRETSEAGELRDDEERFLDVSTFIRYVVEEHVIL